MISVTKEEKEIISRTYPKAHIVRTAKQRSKRHHYYCEENRAVMALLKSLRETDNDTTQQDLG